MAACSMIRKNTISCFRYGTLVAALTVFVAGWRTNGQESSRTTEPAADANRADEQTFRDVVQPALQKYCVRCHGADKMKSGVRVDLLTAAPEDKHLPLWKNI